MRFAVLLVIAKDRIQETHERLIIAIVFGGMPVSGGSRSKIYSAVVGALSMTLLSQIMLMLNLNSGVSQMVKAIIFIAVVYISMSDNRKNILPR